MRKQSIAGCLSPPTRPGYEAIHRNYLSVRLFWLCVKIYPVLQIVLPVSTILVISIIAERLSARLLILQCVFSVGGVWL